MVFENLLNPSTTDILLVLVIFLIFVMIVKKVINIVTNVVVIAVAAILAPIAANRFLGMNVPTDINSLFNFMLLGVALYFAYMGLSFAYKFARGAAKAGKKVLPKGGKREKVKVVEKVIEKQRGQEEKGFFNSPSHPKSEKALFKDYVVLGEDDDRDFRPKQRKENLEEIKEDDYVDVEPLKEIKPKKRRK